MSGYSILLPPPWQRINLGRSMADDVRAVVDRAVARAPKEIPPDQLSATRHRLERELMDQLAAAKQRGGVDFYFPAHPLEGTDLNASFVVSSVVPDALVDPQAAPRVLAELVSAGAEPVTIADTVWARSEEDVESSGEALVEAGLRARKVDYMTAVPGEEHRWVLVTCTVVGDGDPDSEHTRLVVELFDAMMTTWRWQDGT